MSKEVIAPIRVQRKRTKGWGMPENTVYVGRPSRWGNPFKVNDFVKLGSGGNGFMYWKTTSEYASKEYENLDTVEKVLDVYERFIKAYPPKGIEELRGKNLACWCPLDKPCHADVLLKISNQ